MPDVYCRFKNLPDALAAIGEFLVPIEAVVFRAPAMRIVTKRGLRLFDQPVRFSADVTGRYVQKLGAQPLGQAHNVFHAIDVRGKGGVQGREELHQPGAIDDRAKPAR